ncbi:MAG: UDP binding domain-containing protein [Eggerthella sp.]|nr:UDP binding domain-containing protein [Eggerthella sp.]
MGARVLVLGVAYKQDIDDYRESPALRVIERLEEQGAEVSYYDPWVPRYCHKGEARESIPDLSAEAIASADIVLVACAHTNVDYAFVQRHARAVLDAKNAMKGVSPRENVEVL